MSEPALSCPRCATTMTPRIAEPRPGAKAIRADVCGTCAGIWLDEYELAEVADALGGLPFRMDEIAVLAAPGKNVARCPRCGGTPSELTVLDVAIDFCMGCRGVWLDGSEYEAMAEAAAIEAAQRAETTGSYRTAPQAAKALKHGMFDCPHCEEDTPTSEAMLTSGGMVCGPCFHAHDEARMLDEASRDHGELTAKLKGVGKYAPPADRERHAAYARASLGILGALFDVRKPEYCELCGRKRSSLLCSHY